MTGNRGGWSGRREVRTHRVRPGDNLSRLALQYGVSLEALVALNHIQDARLLWVGQILTLPEQEATAATSSNLQSKAAKVAPPSANSENEEVNELGIVCWDGTPSLRLRSSPVHQDSNVIGTLPFSMVLQVMNHLPGKWLQVTTRDGRIGYVSADHVWLAPQHPLPEPGVRLHRVLKGERGTAIAIAEAHFENIRWGQDLRAYVALLASANRRPIPRGTDGWKKLSFQAGELIWVPSQEFAEAMRGLFNSGSLTYELATESGMARAIERLSQLQSDLREAIRRAVRHIGPAIKRHVEESIVSILSSLLLMAAGAVLLLALSTLIGAALGFVLGAGAGAAPGAAAGFKVGLALMEWLGLAFLVKWVASSVVRIGSAFVAFFVAVSEARGDSKKLEQAALQLAEALGLCMGLLVEALVMWTAARGIATALTQLKGTTFARKFGETNLSMWLKKRVGEYKNGESKLPGPSETAVRLQAPAIAKELGINIDTARALLRAFDAKTLRALNNALGTDGLVFLLTKPSAFHEILITTLGQAGKDAVAQASFKELLRLNRKGTLTNAVTHQALIAYSAFMKNYNNKISGDFLSRFWRELALDKAEAKAELRLARDLLAGKTPLGTVRLVDALAESNVAGERMPEFRVTTQATTRLVESKLIGEKDKPLTINTLSNNASKAHSQIKSESSRTGESEGLIRLDARGSGKTPMDAQQVAANVSKSTPNPRDSQATRWVEVFYYNTKGELVQLVLELKSGRFAVYSERTIE